MNLWLMFSLCVMVKPDSSAVYILNEHLQLVTSTSLRWVRNGLEYRISAKTFKKCLNLLKNCSGQVLVAFHSCNSVLSQFRLKSSATSQLFPTLSQLIIFSLIFINPDSKRKLSLTSLSCKKSCKAFSKTAV